MKKNKLAILWTNADPITAELMVMMYAVNAIKRDWWEQVQIIIWGATAKLVAENQDIQEKLINIKDTGVDVSFCMACASELGVAEQIESLGFELKYWGEPLTEIIKGNEFELITV